MLVATFFESRKTNPEDEKHREDAYTKFGIWWSVGLVFLLVTWKAGANPIWPGVLLSLYTIASALVKIRNRKITASINSVR
jgi:hypothetical protein